MSDPGTLVLVVGPSGAGKDTLIAAARRRLSSRPDIVFARRFITRPADAGGEPHIGISEGEFAARMAGGAFTLHWDAHGLRYGIPASIEQDLAVGQTVVANVSRTVIDTARQRITRVRVAHVTADSAVRAARLARRGRETEAEILRRMDRGGLTAPQGPDVITIDNGGPLQRGVAQFVDVVCGVAGITGPVA